MENKKWDDFRGSQKGKPPRVGIWRPAVPTWEKKFCKEIGLVKWEALVKAKKDIHLYGNVMNWDDSAAKDAFFDAKNRYWAQINGLPCHVPLPDPDLYIDKDINHDKKDSMDDHNNLAAADKALFSSHDHHRHHEPVIIFGDSLAPRHPFTGYGWGDEFKAADAQPPNNQFFSSTNHAAAAAAAVRAKGNDYHHHRDQYYMTSSSSRGRGFNQKTLAGWGNKLVVGPGKAGNK